MKLFTRLVPVITCVLLAGCATGKTIKDAEDIRDDGSRNIVLLTHEVTVYVGAVDSSVRDTKLTFRCPSGRNPLNADCFSLKVPYRGTADFEGFGVQAFELSGSKAMKMKYGEYVLDSISHSVVIGRTPEITCTYDKKLKKDICSTSMKDETKRFRVDLPQAINISVSPGTGCYLGHLKMIMVNNEIREFSLDSEALLTEERLSNMSGDFAATVLGFVDRPCR